MKRITILLTLMSILFSRSFSQEPSPDHSAAWLLPASEAMARLSLKSNLLYDVTTSFNLGAELRLNNYLTLDLSVTYNPWTFSDNKKFKHLLIQPELRYWINEPFNGHFVGAHLLYTTYNAGNLHLPLDILPSLKDYRYRGNAYGLGFSYGYQWLLAPRWALEASLGWGYMYMNYTKYDCKSCGKKVGEGTKHYFGPTKAALSLIYIIH